MARLPVLEEEECLIGPGVLPRIRPSDRVCLRCAFPLHGVVSGNRGIALEAVDDGRAWRIALCDSQDIPFPGAPPLEFPTEALAVITTRRITLWDGLAGLCGLALLPLGQSWTLFRALREGQDRSDRLRTGVIGTLVIAISTLMWWVTVRWLATWIMGE